MLPEKSLNSIMIKKLSLSRRLCAVLSCHSRSFCNRVLVKFGRVQLRFMSDCSLISIIYWSRPPSSAVGKRRRGLIKPKAKRPRSQSPCVTDDLDPDTSLGETDTHNDFSSKCSHSFLFSDVSALLQVRSTWSQKWEFSVTSAPFSTWMSKMPRTSTAKARNTRRTWRYPKHLSIRGEPLE